MGALWGDLGSWLDGHGEVLLGLLLLVAVLLSVTAVLARRQWQSRQRLRQRLASAHSELSDLRGRDPLTGLVSRETLEEELAATVTGAEAAGRSVCVAYLGLDGFRAINDAYGMRVGDAVLKEIATRLSDWLGGKPQVTRVGGDEFALFCKCDAAGLDELARTLQRIVGQPLKAEALNLQVGLSVGLALYPDDGARPRLVAHAGLAMRTAKLTGGNGHARFDPAMSTPNWCRICGTRWPADSCNWSISPRSMHVRCRSQPQRHCCAGSTPSAESSARRSSSRWPNATASSATSAPGSSKRPADRRRSGAKWGCACASPSTSRGTNRMTCEITESLAIEDTPATRGAFDRMRQAGLHVSIDDFGAGFSSSLAQIRRLAPAELKIDSGFVKDLEHSEDARAIVRAIVQLARSLQLHVVAEGVETEAQRDILVALGCDELQGYLFAKPMSATALALWASGDGPSEASAFRPSLFDPTAPSNLE
jgi:diguanylate cyclase (GGDEF)-like protein